MIRRLVLTNWRAYESADISFEPGTTFVVARNGVGKTSLLEAARWGLCGQLVEFRSSPVRKGADRATVSVTVQLPNAQIVRIDRTIFANTKISPTISIDLNGNPVDESELDGLLEDTWSAPLPFIANAVFLTETLRTANDDQDLRSQLCRWFGITEFEADATRLADRVDELEKELRGRRSVQRAEIKRVEQSQNELIEAESRLDAAKASLESARERLGAARAAQDQVVAFQEARRRAEEWDVSLVGLLDRAAKHVPTPRPEALIDQLGEVLESLEERLSAVRREIAMFDAQAAVIERGLNELREAGANCPVCRRPLRPEDRDRAEKEHRRELELLRTQRAGLDESPLVEVMKDVRALARDVSSLGSRPSTDLPEPGESIETFRDYDSIQAEFEQAVANHSAIQAHTEDLRTELADQLKMDAVSSALVKGHREWALTEAAHTALRGTVDELLDDQVIPLQAAVADRWNRIFPDRPHLNMDAHGRMWRPLNDEELPWNAFSAGEQTIALLFQRLVALTSATTAAFSWVDEPLEHLDPTTRRLTASMLARATMATGLTQLVITTYEEDLARRLAAADEHARVLYVRTGVTEELQQFEDLARGSMKQ